MPDFGGYARESAAPQLGRTRGACRAHMAYFCVGLSGGVGDRGQNRRACRGAVGGMLFA
jgi:hypothetical protein